MGSVYLHDTIGVTAQCNLDLLHEIAGVLRQLHGCWIVCGDWNCTPEELVRTGWLDFIDDIVHYPKSPTCNGKVYDFFVVKRCFNFAVHSVHTVYDAIAPGCAMPSEPSVPIRNSHKPVRLFLRAAPRCIMVRGIRRPHGFPAVLPCGPQAAPTQMVTGSHIACTTPVSRINIDQEHAHLISAIKDQLSVIMGHGLDETFARSGRANGPTFRWRNAYGPLSSDIGRTSPVARAWRRTATWLADIIQAGVFSREAASARWLVFHYNHKLPSSLDACAFSEWVKAICTQMLLNRSWAECLAQVATKAAEQAERQAYQAASRTWASWLIDGPCKGLGRQHRLSRTALGWTPTVVGTMGETRLSEADVLNGLDERHLQAIRRPQMDVYMPLNAQQVADQEAGAWAV